MTTGAQRFPVVRFVFAGQSSDCGGEGRPWTLVYDGNCKVCGRLVRLLERWDRRKRIEIIPSQNTCVLAGFPWIPAEAYAEAGRCPTSRASAAVALAVSSGWSRPRSPANAQQLQSTGCTTSSAAAARAAPGSR